MSSSVMIAGATEATDARIRDLESQLSTVTAQRNQLSRELFEAKQEIARLQEASDNVSSQLQGTRIISHRSFFRDLWF